jgi:hypothetical protein
MSQGREKKFVGELEFQNFVVKRVVLRKLFQTGRGRFARKNLESLRKSWKYIIAIWKGHDWQKINENPELIIFHNNWKYQYYGRCQKSTSVSKGHFGPDEIEWCSDLGLFKKYGACKKVAWKWQNADLCKKNGSGTVNGIVVTRLPKLEWRGHVWWKKGVCQALAHFDTGGRVVRLCALMKGRAHAQSDLGHCKQTRNGCGRGVRK